MTSRRTEISCRRCGAPGRWYLGGRLCPRHAPGGPDGEVMRAFPDYTGRIPQVGPGIIDPAKTQSGPRGATNTVLGGLTPKEEGLMEESTRAQVPTASPREAV